MKGPHMVTESKQTSTQLFRATLVGLVLWLGSASPTVAYELRPSPKPDLPKRGISAHRGGLLGCPVNTIGAFQRAVCQGVHQIELDVRATEDNVIVIAHDDQITGQHQTLQISESTIDQLRKLELPACAGAPEKNEHIPTFEEALAMMPENIWVNVDIKNNDPRVGKLVAETVGRAHRFDQVMFAARDKAVPTIRQVAKEAESQSWIVNMNRKLFRCQYVNATINSCAEFIQLVELPYIPFVRGKPNHDTMERLKDAGVRVNYSWLRAEEEEKLKEELQDLFNRKIDFVLVDHVEQAMKAADTLGIPRLIPYWNHATLKTDQAPFHCPLAQ